MSDGHINKAQQEIAAAAAIQRPMRSDSPNKVDLVAENYHGIDTRAIPTGTDEVYERKIAILNQALIDIGMGGFQWKIFAMTGFGWFVDNVSEVS
jgi:hypothetical protein